MPGPCAMLIRINIATVNASFSSLFDSCISSKMTLYHDIKSTIQSPALTRNIPQVKAKGIHDSTIVYPSNKIKPRI